MVRVIPRLALIPILLVLVTACSGPNAPSSTTTSNPTAAPVTTAQTTTPPEPGVPADVAEAGGFELLGSDPGPGSEIALEDVSAASQILRTLTARLAFRSNASLTDALWEVDLLDGSGRHCASANPVDRL